MDAAGRRHIRKALSRLERELPMPWNINQLVTSLAQKRSRLIRLVPWQFPAGDGSPSGLWMPTATADYIFYDETASHSRREQIIGHELGHILLGHTPRLRDAPAGLIEALAPSVSPELARRFLALARNGYGERDEAVAEEFGTSLIRRGVTKRRPGGPDELGRLTDSL